MVGSEIIGLDSAQGHRAFERIRPATRKFFARASARKPFSRRCGHSAATAGPSGRAGGQRSSRWWKHCARPFKSFRSALWTPHTRRSPALESAIERGPEDAAESHLEAAFAAAEIYERLVQLEAMAAPSMLLDWLALKQAAMAAARGALESAEALLPSLRDAGTVARIKSGTAEIEAKLSGKPVTTGK